MQEEEDINDLEPSTDAETTTLFPDYPEGSECRMPSMSHSSLLWIYMRMCLHTRAWLHVGMSSMCVWRVAEVPQAVSVDTLIGLANTGSRKFNVTRIWGSLHSALEYKYNHQNVRSSAP